MRFGIGVGVEVGDGGWDGVGFGGEGPAAGGRPCFSLWPSPPSPTHIPAPSPISTPTPRPKPTRPTASDKQQTPRRHRVGRQPRRRAGPFPLPASPASPRSSTSPISNSSSCKWAPATRPRHHSTPRQHLRPRPGNQPSLGRHTAAINPSSTSSSAPAPAPCTSQAPWAGPAGPSFLRPPLPMALETCRHLLRYPTMLPADGARTWHRRRSPTGTGKNGAEAGNSEMRQAKPRGAAPWNPAKGSPLGTH